MIQPLQLPEVPPDGPWAAYVLVVIWLPLVLRAMLLLIPFRKVIGKLAPHSGWALKKLKELPVRGFGLLAINEIFALMIPPILVLIIRFSNNPIGWQSWSEVSNVGGIVLFASLLLWIFFDVLRIMRVRRMMKAVEKHDIAKLRKVADASFGARSFLRKFSRKIQKSMSRTTNRYPNRWKNCQKVTQSLGCSCIDGTKTNPCWLGQQYCVRCCC